VTAPRGARYAFRMPAPCFERSVTVRATPRSVYAELADPQRQIGLQPLLVDVAEIPTPDPDRTRRFEAVEAIRLLGFVPLRNRIRVRVDCVAPPEIIDFEARSFPRITVRSRFTLARDGDGTLVRESVSVTAPAPLRSFVLREAVRAQETLLANLARRLGSTEAAS